MFLSLSVAMATPHLISLQGYATDLSDKPIDGDIRVTIYNSTYNEVWNSGTLINEIKNGIFDVLLGGVTPLDLDNTQLHYMDIEVRKTGFSLEKVVDKQAFYPGGGQHAITREEFDALEERVEALENLHTTTTTTTPSTTTTTTSTIPLECVDADGDGYDGYNPIYCPTGTDCNDANFNIRPGAVEVCDGIDNDCDPASADGSGDPLVGVACDGADSDLCKEGTTSCSAGALVCSDTTGSTTDLCNGVDDDCDPASADGSEDPLLGQACDGADSDLCNEGTYSCVGGTLSCSDNTGSTLDLCNGVDDDCDPASADGSEDPLVGIACDGPDSDLCKEGTSSCTAGTITCSDSTGSTVDLCNGVDDDCDPASADGSEDPQVGQACDGADTDLCNEGTKYCSAGSLMCSDTTGSTTDLCNGVDDDCDPASADGSEDPLVGIACDGPDSDLCKEGTTSCTSGTVVCSDTTGSTVENDAATCSDLIDNDCDTFTDCADLDCDPYCP